jgi:prepilin-type N-terminal cleavage/methylation domain-containing protein
LLWYGVELETQVQNRQTDGGFTLIDMLVAMALFLVLAAMATPALKDVTGSLRLGTATREVERELQTARLKAVTSNRTLRVRFNCPAAGQYRMVELIGTPSKPDAADDTTDRCSGTKYPYPVADQNPLTLPNLDGPLRQLSTPVTFSNPAALEFWPDGTVHYSQGSNPWAQVPPAGTSLTLVSGTTMRTITVNGLGKIQIQQ